MEMGANEMDNHGIKPKRIKLENDSVDVELEDFQERKPQPSVYNFSCHKCPDNFATREEIIHHWTESHGLHPSNCSVCNAHFPTSMEMWDHKVSIHGIPCEICESLFETEEKLTDHVKSVHLKNESNQEEIEKWNFEDTKDNQDFKAETVVPFTLPTNSQSGLQPKPLESQSRRGDANSKVSASTKPSFTCHLCPENFKKVWQIKRHWKKTHGLKTTQCPRCQKPFPSKRLMILHRVAEHEFPCQICNKSFKKPIGLEEHVKVVHGLVPQNCCTICGMVFTRGLDVKNHVLKFHADVPGLIKRCDVWDHKVGNHGISCKLCQTLFENEEKLTDHVKSVHPDESNQEENGKQEYFEDESGIGMSSTLPSSSKTELETTSSNSQSQSANRISNLPASPSVDLSFPCHLCREKFHTMHQIKHHWHDVHNLQTSHCVFCKKLFPSRLQMSIHRDAEHGITCEICNKNFDKQTRLENHVRKVHGLVTQSCCTICGMVFTAELDLKKHVVNFHSDVPGSIKRCDVCQYTCLTEEDMVKHKGVHMTYTCPVCGMVLPSKNAAKRHRVETKHGL